MTETTKLSDRLRAGGLHFIISALIVGTAVALIVYFWYPLSIVNAIGAGKIFFLIALVDIGIGPLLTTIVFNKRKPELKRDLSIIACIQITALIYGVHTVTSARPVYYVFAVDRFELVQAHSLKPNSNQKDAKYTLHYGRPRWVGAVLPDDPEAQNDVLFSAVDKSYDLAQIPDYYMPYDTVAPEIKKRAKPLKQLAQFNEHESKQKELESFLNLYGDETKFGYVPMTSTKLDLTVVIDKVSGEPVKIIDFKPW